MLKFVRNQHFIQNNELSGQYICFEAEQDNG